MLGKSQERKVDLRNASVLEVIIAVIIVLVIFIYGNDLDFADQVDAFQDRIAMLIKERDGLSKDLKSKISENRALKKSNRELREENDFLRQFVSADSEDGSELLALQKYITELEDKVSILEEQLAAARSALQNSGKGGIDKPFCRLPVADNSLRQIHRFLGQVSWTDEGIIFSISDKLVPAEARLIPGVSELELYSPLSYADFESSARLTYSDSRAKDPECRYFVEIMRDPKVDAPSSFLLLVERFFYKRIRSL